MDNEKSAKKCIEALDGYDLHSQLLEVKFSDSDTAKSYPMSKFKRKRGDYRDGDRDYRNDDYRGGDRFGGGSRGRGRGRGGRGDEGVKRRNTYDYDKRNKYNDDYYDYDDEDYYDEEDNSYRR